jgi:pyridoxine kinase
MERLGVRVLQMPTTILGRRPDRGVPGGGPVAKATLASMIDALDFGGELKQVDAVLSGYLGAPNQVEIVLDLVERVKRANPKAIFFCDPVLGDNGELFVSSEIANAVTQGLAPNADWLSPNVFELGHISGRPVESLAQARYAAVLLGKPMLVTSLPTETGLGVLCAAPNGHWFCETPMLPKAPKGVGDLLTALFLARRVKGEAAPVALEASIGAVYDVLVRTLAAESDDLALPEAQEFLADPQTWPRATALEAI